MLSSLAVSLGRAGALQSPVITGAVCAVAHHIRPWLASSRFRRCFAAQALQAFDSDSEIEQLAAAPHPSSSVVDKLSEKVAPIPAVAGRIHSVDTFSAVDGPGLRMVVFEQVCGRSQNVKKPRSSSFILCHVIQHFGVLPRVFAV